MPASQAIDRRALLTATGALLGGLALQGCTTTAGRAAGPPPGCRLHPVDVRRERHIRTLVGLRPFRDSGFVVRAEALGNKRLVHNYGHGGAGITLSWGSSRLALDAGLPGHSGPVAVIGAGVMGLTTARLLQEAGYPVRIYAEQLPPHTTSDIAGGQWYPSLVYRRAALTPAFERQLVTAAAYSYRRFQIMIGDRYGVRWMRNYELSRRASGPGTTDRLIAGMMPEARSIEPDAHPFAAPFVRQYDGMIIETPVFLRQMLDDIRLAGGEIAIRSFRDAAELAALPETLIFNCTGLGAKALFGDEELVPMRGQLEILLPQPEVDYAVSAPGGIYMFSRRDGIILGGTAERGEWSTAPSATAADRIFDRHRQLFDAFRCAPPA
ncbi:MAG: FAD-dependent oxidoreductase [Parasphingopyxis sp.]|uniref:FAD-dependent oxidoreductase n=1 Tax=Parasphingopyxis sp. TaxID=1920299 RepID=UPI003F9F77DC